MTRIRDLALLATLTERLEPADAPLPELRGLQPAGVVALLLPNVDGDGGAGLLLIERAHQLRAHGGQLAFPGGKPEPSDRNLLDTALREAEEEVGLSRDDACVLGRLPAVPTPTGFMIVPFVAWAPAGWQAIQASPEVHRILTPTLATLADHRVHRVAGRGVWQGFAYELHEFAIHKPPLWGATARMVWELLERLTPPAVGANSAEPESTDPFE